MWKSQDSKAFVGGTWRSCELIAFNNNSHVKYTCISLRQEKATLMASEAGLEEVVKYACQLADVCNTLKRLCMVTLFPYLYRRSKKVED